MTLNKVFFLLFTIIVISCHHKHGMGGDQSNPLYDEVMKVHDDIMPEMKTLHKNKKFLEAWKEDNALSPADQATVDSLIASIEAADEGMMSWMGNFNVPDDSLLVEKYLLGEKEKVQKVSDDMQKAIESSNAFIQRVKPDEK